MRCRRLRRWTGGAAGCGPADGLLVGPGRRHDVVGVGDAHDPGTEADLGAGEAVRVAGAVPSLVVLDDHVAPAIEPLHERSRDLCAVLRMAADDLPLLRVGLAVLVEQSPGDV